MFKRTVVILIILCIMPVFALSAVKTVLDHSSLTPSNGSLINNSRPSISAEYVDEGIGVSPGESRLYLDGQDVTSSSQASQNKITFVPSNALADGSHKVKLDVVDRAGNVDTVTWSFTIHTQPPKIKITSHNPGQFVNRSPALISGTVDNPRARIVVNGIAAFVEKGSFAAKVSLVDGNNTISAVATDSFGNTGSDSITLVVDTKPPIVDITAPSANSVINSKTVTVTGTVSKGIASVTINTQAGGEGVKAEISSGSFTAKDVKLSEGTNTIMIKAVCLAGNTGTAYVRVTVDSVPPRITITAPRDMKVENRKIITVTGTVDDPTAMVRINNTPVQASRGLFALSSANLTEGNNTITATAVDRAGNQAKPASVTILLDTTPPSSPSLNALPSVTRTPALPVSGSAEPGAKVELFVNSASKGAVKADDKGSFQFTINLSEGNSALTAIAYDVSGNASAPSAVSNVFLDTKPPKIL